MSENKQAPSKKPQPKRRKRKVRWGRVALLVLIVLLVLAAVAALAWLVISAVSDSGDGSSRPAFLGVTEIVVEGASHYTDEQIIQAGGLSLGQSVFSLNKRAAAERILQQCCYVEKVTVESKAVTTLHIRVEETTVIGAVPIDERLCWLLGANGKALETVAVGSSRLEGLLQLYAPNTAQATAGTLLLDHERLTVVTELRALLTSAEFTGLAADIDAVDLTDLSAVRLRWRDQIVVLLKGTEDLSRQLGVVKESLAKVMEKYEADTIGQLRLYPYQDVAAVYTPLEELPSFGQAVTLPTTAATSTETTTEVTVTTTQVAA